MKNNKNEYVRKNIANSIKNFYFYFYQLIQLKSTNFEIMVYLAETQIAVRS